VYTSYGVSVDAPTPTRSSMPAAPVADADREALKRALLPLLSTSPSRGITLQLSHALKHVVQRDFPEQWPGLLGEVKRMLASGAVREVASGCVAALEVVRAFRSAPSTSPMCVRAC
jgi:hypothetical protein